jgi:hypothetical protein
MKKNIIFSDSEKTMNSQVLSGKASKTKLSRFLNQGCFIITNYWFKNKSNEAVGVCFKKLFIALAFILAVTACEKTEVGYLSDNIFYRVNPFNIQQGVTKFSSPVVANGSTSPLTVKLLKVYDADGNDVTETFTTPQSIVTFKSTITYKDSTLELLAAALQDSLVTPFAVNNIGGRLEFSAATTYLSTGTFNIDINVGNSKGNYDIENACQININPVVEDETYDMNYKRIQTYKNNNGYDLSSTANDQITVDVQYISGISNGAWCIYKFKDKNGNFFNPAKGEVGRRSGYPFFDNWAPWYDIQLTDTAFVHQMPAYAGIDFPYYNKPGEEFWEDPSARYDFRIPKGCIKGLDEDLFGLISFQYHAVGTFLITTQLHQFERADN